MSFQYAKTLDMSNERPLYIQLLDMIKENIKSNNIKPGDILPSEAELAKYYNLSRTTVRLTLSELEKEELIIRRRGLGTFVTQPKIKRKLDNLYSFTMDMQQLGLKPTSRMLSFNLVNTDVLPLDKNLFSGDKLYEIYRLRLADGKPILVEKTYIQEAFCRGLTEEMLLQDSLYRIFEDRYRLVLDKATETYEPIVLNQEYSELLECKKGTPSFFIHRITLDKDGKLIEYTESVTPGSNSRFEITLLKDTTRINRSSY